MSAQRQPRLLPLAEAARLSGRDAADLRRWCATGRLQCERVGHDWMVFEEDVHTAAQLTDVAPAWAARAVLSIAFPDRANGEQAHRLLRERFGLQPADLGLAPLALDGADLVLVAGVFPADRLDEVLTTVRSLGGVIVDGVDELRITARPHRPDDEHGQSSYG